MRLFLSASLFLPLALVSVPGVAHAVGPESGCVASDGRSFPLSTRIHGGPSSYEAGGGYGTWYLELTNNTGATCENVHPVVVLVDDRRVLRSSQPRLEFYTGAQTRPVRFETTDQDELVGAFDGFPGFTVGPQKTVTVKVRLAVTSDAAPNRVTANAAVVQRHDDDGDWVGQSNDYRFGIDSEPEATTGTADPDPGRSTAPRLPFAEELARTGTSAAAIAATLAALLTGGGALLLLRRRR
ncbi:LPXTG cell wall anchor domain-containing protein [Streptomyces sp. NBC_00287]|uniref:LPXTG cell wall anchor domain-containing protein n=1 Tax=Streptomyces sp. NBC_00287 TaxID=2975702 RepID=UPI002E2C463A|nr:LPXTG cell wall anchor domain-containing protein [Streptomyces sp. NBC_00287]